MFESHVELLLKHHPIYFPYRQQNVVECLDELERRKPPPPDMVGCADFEERTRSILDMVELAVAALLLAGFIALMAVSAGAPPPAATVAELIPPGER